MDHLLSKETWETIARAGVHVAPGTRPRRDAGREATSARPDAGTARRLPPRARTTREPLQAIDRRNRDDGAGSQDPAPDVSAWFRAPPGAGRGRPSRVLPRPLAGGQAREVRLPHRSFTIRLLVTHAVWSWQVDSSTDVDPDGSAWDLNHPMRGSLLRGPERRETRRTAPDEMGLMARMIAASADPSGSGRGRVGVVKSIRARGGCLGVIR